MPIKEFFLCVNLAIIGCYALHRAEQSEKLGPFLLHSFAGFFLLNAVAVFVYPYL